MQMVMFKIPSVLVCCLKHSLASAQVVMLRKTGVGKHVYQEKVDKCFKKQKRSKTSTNLASAQNHKNNEAERCDVSTCAKFVKQLRSLDNSTTSSILSTFHNMHTMMNSTTPRVVVHISSFSVSSSALGEIKHSDHRSAFSRISTGIQRHVTARVRSAEP